MRLTVRTLNDGTQTLGLAAHGRRRRRRGLLASARQLEQPERRDERGGALVAALVELCSQRPGREGLADAVYFQHRAGGPALSQFSAGQ